MVDQHFILDIGPGLASVLLALIVAVPGIVAALYSRSNGQKIDAGNSELAARLAKVADAKAATAALTLEPTTVGPKVG